jgi:uncharacterized protein DUF998
MVPDLGKSPSQQNGALAGIIGPAVFAFVIVVLTLVQYDFMVGLGWRPVRGSDVPWPSGLALGPLGWLQVANFVLFGLALIAFAVGLHRGVGRAGRGSSVGPALLILAGVAMVLAGFETDPDLSAGLQTWHGLVRSRLLPVRLFVAARFLLPVVAAQEGPSLARLRCVHHDHRCAVHTVVPQTGAGGVLPLARPDTGLGGGHGDPAPLRLR